VPFSDPLDTVEISPLDDSAPFDDDSRPEPMLAATPFLIEFDEPARLDPERIGLTWEVPPPVRSGMRWLSSLGSLALHLLPLLLIIAWPTTTTEVPVIPVQLVLEQPPPPPPEQQAPQPPQPNQPKQGRLASEDLGDVKPKTAGETPTEEPAAAGEKQPEQSETQTATATATPPPIPPPKPAPPNEQNPVVHTPKPSGAAIPHREETPREAPRAARFSGPASSRDEYLAYLVSLTRQHIDLLPMSVVGTRRGETIVTVTVLDNGAIAHVSVLRSSGFPDIDQRIEQMVAAVGKFPPVPQWFQGDSLQLQLTLRFPEALEKE
jgi:TonB family protein